jgi:excisionase family DNA binding protein
MLLYPLADRSFPLLKLSWRLLTVSKQPDRQPTFATAAKGEFEPLLDTKSIKIQSDRTAILALPDDAILTLSEVAAWLKLHPKTVSQMARERRIPAITLPLGSKRKQFRFVKGAVGKWLSSAVVSSLTLVVPSQKGAK